jgi:hypothetical protein
MFRASLAHPQEALHEQSFGGCSVLLQMSTVYGIWLDFGLTIPREQSTSITAYCTHQNCVRVQPPEDGQVVPEKCRGFEF